MEIVEVVDPWNTPLVETFIIVSFITIGAAIGALALLMMRARQVIRAAQRQAMREHSAIDQAMRAIWEAQPLDVRVSRELEETALQMGQMIMDSMPTTQEFADALSKMLNGKIGPRDHTTRRIIEEMEADAPLPPVFWAVEGVGGRWMVLHETEDGDEAFTFPNCSSERHRYARELEARYVAARLNLHPESVAAKRDMLGYHAYRPGLVALFGETYADESL